MVRRRSLLARSFFWGGVIILWGVSLILEAVFPVSIPFGRLASGLILIYIGLRILSRGRL